MPACLAYVGWTTNSLDASLLPRSRHAGTRSGSTCYPRLVLKESANRGALDWSTSTSDDEPMRASQRSSNAFCLPWHGLVE
jgi:hypothetical protein